MHGLGHADVHWTVESEERESGTETLAGDLVGMAAQGPWSNKELLLEVQELGTSSRAAWQFLTSRLDMHGDRAAVVQLLQTLTVSPILSHFMVKFSDVMALSFGPEYKDVLLSALGNLVVDPDCFFMRKVLELLQVPENGPFTGSDLLRRRAELQASGWAELGSVFDFDEDGCITSSQDIKAVVEDGFAAVKALLDEWLDEFLDQYVKEDSSLRQRCLETIYGLIANGRPIITCGDIMDLFRSMMQESINRDLQHQSKGNVVSSVLAAAESLTHDMESRASSSEDLRIPQEDFVTILKEHIGTWIDKMKDHPLGKEIFCVLMPRTYGPRAQEHREKMMQIVSENVSQWITPFLDNVAEEVFAVIDWEETGSITVESFKQTISFLDAYRPNVDSRFSVLVSRLMLVLDTDGDGEISREDANIKTQRLLDLVREAGHMLISYYLNLFGLHFWVASVKEFMFELPGSSAAADGGRVVSSVEFTNSLSGAPFFTFKE